MEKLLKYAVLFVVAVALNWVVWQWLNRTFGRATVREPMDR